ncbi:hypothetical protein G7054_g6003 [Neopestalotiopsis clavispora]|nr:hypothetical protein G7054_g6003 [Neopestalotiopsis clavispora]
MIYEFRWSSTRSWRDISSPCDEEIEEILEEEHKLICLLDDLVEEFVVELRTSGNSLQRFLIHYWAPRMEYVLEDRRATKISSEDILVAEQIGVTWELTSESEEDEESCPPSPTLSKRFEAFLEEMDEIVATATQTDSM